MIRECEYKSVINKVKIERKINNSIFRLREGNGISKYIRIDDNGNLLFKK